MQHGALRTDRCSGLSIGPSTPSTSTCSTSVPRNSIRNDSTPYPATKRSWSTRRLARRDQFRDSKETKMRTSTEHGEARCVICWNGWRECIEISLDEEASALSDAPRSILSTAPSGTFDKKGVSGKLQKDRNYEVCKRTKITRAPCRKRTGNQVLRAEKFGDLMTADHNVLIDD